MNDYGPPSILWIGNGEHPEFAETIAALRATAQVVEYRTITQSLELDPADDCALIVVAEALPGEHPRVGYEAIRRVRFAPPLVRVYGSLCEGELRTNPPSAAIRLPWLRAAAALADDWRRLQRGECPSWGRPAAASDEERLLADVPAGTVTLLPACRVGLVVREPATAGWLADALQRRGVRTVRLTTDTPTDAGPLDAIVWDQPLDTTLQAAELKQIQAGYPQSPLIVLAGFPRIHELPSLRAAGAVAVLAKPLAPGELEAAILTALDRR